MVSAYTKYHKVAIPKGFVWPTVVGGTALAALLSGRKKTVNNPATDALKTRQNQLEEANRLAADPTGMTSRQGG